jgi:hypothetical protein
MSGRCARLPPSNGWVECHRCESLWQPATYGEDWRPSECVEKEPNRATTYDEYVEKTHKIINEISDICATTVVTDQMTLEQVVGLLHDTLARIDVVAVYPERERPPGFRLRQVPLTVSGSSR